jgi:hypothetical protein
MRSRKPIPAINNTVDFFVINVNTCELIALCQEEEKLFHELTAIIIINSFLYKCISTIIIKEKNKKKKF